MSPLDTQRPYWFDDAPLAPPAAEPVPSAWQELRKGWSAGGRARLGAVLKADVKAIAGDWWNKDRSDRIEAFAEANGLGFDAQSYVTGKDLPGLVFQRQMGERRSAVTWGEDLPYVEFANYVKPGEDAGESDCWGYVAIRHGLSLPHVVVDARANDADGGGADSARPVTSLGEGSMVSSSPLASSPHRLKRLDVGGAASGRFMAWAPKGTEEQARPFVGGQALTLVESLVDTFDVEFVDGWVFLYGYYLDISSEEADRWAWVFSVASRVLDQLAAWGGPAAPVDAPFYTRGRVPRPASLAELPAPWSRRATGAWNAAFGRDGFATW